MSLDVVPLLLRPGRGKEDLLCGCVSRLVSWVKGSIRELRSVTLTSHSLTFSPRAHCCATSWSTWRCSRRSLLLPRTTTVTWGGRGRGLICCGSSAGSPLAEFHISTSGSANSVPGNHCFSTFHKELTWNIVNMPLSCPWICLFPSWPRRPSWKTPGCRRCRPARSRRPQSSNVWADPDHRGALWCRKAWAAPSRRGQSPPRPRTRPPGSRRTRNLEESPNDALLARRGAPRPLRYLRTDYVVSVQKMLEDRRFPNCRLTTNHNFATFPHFGPGRLTQIRGVDGFTSRTWR